MTKKILGLVVFLVLSLSAFAKDSDDSFAKHFNHQNGIALHGYDVVSYHQGMALMGEAAYEVNFKGVDFRFSSAGNAQLFRDQPEKYLPEYGGWCATAVGMMNQKLDITPDSYLIESGKLYLFSTSMGPAKDMWTADPSIKGKADKNWKKISAH